MNEVFKLEVNFYELNAIIKGLKELPYKESNNLIDKIIADYEKQAKEAQVAAKEVKKEKARELKPKDSKA